MLLTITNTRPSATDLVWLLYKHPDKVQTFKTTGGTATVFNELYGTEEGQIRYPDHRFECSRAEFSDWCDTIARKYSYQVSLSGLGETDELVGVSSQLAVFQKSSIHDY